MWALSGQSLKQTHHRVARVEPVAENCVEGEIEQRADAQHRQADKHGEIESRPSGKALWRDDTAADRRRGDGAGRQLSLNVHRLDPLWAGA
jgi:hypothetical protein